MSAKSVDNWGQGVYFLPESLQTGIIAINQLTSEEREDYMNLSPAYLKQREEWKLEG